MAADPKRITLLAWAHLEPNPHPVRIEILSANHETKTVRYTIPGYSFLGVLCIPYTALQSVALVDGRTGETLQAFGRPYIGNTPPAWVEYAEAVS